MIVQDALRRSVSVVIPTHNRSDLVFRAVHSALRQTFSPLEVIVVDDASTDSTQEKLALIDDSRLNIIHLGRNVGGAAARNVGVAAAQGEFVAFLDSDDWWLPRKLELQLRRAKESPASGVIYTGVFAAFGDRGMQIPFALHEGNVLDKLSQGWCLPTTSCSLVRTPLLEEVRFDERLPGLQDFDLWLQLSRFTSFAAAPQPLTVFEQHRGPRLSTSVALRSEGLSIIRSKWGDFMAERDLAEPFDEACERWRWNMNYERVAVTPVRQSLHTRLQLVMALPALALPRRSKVGLVLHLLLGAAFHNARTRRAIKKASVPLDP